MKFRARKSDYHNCLSVNIIETTETDAGEDLIVDRAKAWLNVTVGHFTNNTSAKLF